jgi:hypothetical protein
LQEICGKPATIASDSVAASCGKLVDFVTIFDAGPVRKEFYFCPELVVVGMA